MSWLRRLEASLSSRRPGFDTGPVDVDFVVDKLTLEQGFLCILWFPLSVSFHQCSILTYQSPAVSSWLFHYAVHSYLKTETMLSVVLFGQSKISVIDIDDDDGYYKPNILQGCSPV
jgi:hypothetical protein